MAHLYAGPELLHFLNPCKVSELRANAGDQWPKAGLHIALALLQDVVQIAAQNHLNSQPALLFNRQTRLTACPVLVLRPFRCFSDPQLGATCPHVEIRV
jgi:hypothetical protein